MRYQYRHLDIPIEDDPFEALQKLSQDDWEIITVTVVGLPKSSYNEYRGMDDFWAETVQRLWLRKP